VYDACQDEHGRGTLDMAVPGPIAQSLPSRNWFSERRFETSDDPHIALRPPLN
jgi:hypothetical protein